MKYFMLLKINETCDVYKEVHFVSESRLAFTS